MQFLHLPVAVLLCCTKQRVEVLQILRKFRATVSKFTSWYLATWRSNIIRRDSTLNQSTALVLSQFNPPVSVRNAYWDPTETRFSKCLSNWQHLCISTVQAVVKKGWTFGFHKMLQLLSSWGTVSVPESLIFFFMRFISYLPMRPAIIVRLIAPFSDNFQWTKRASALPLSSWSVWYISSVCIIGRERKTDFHSEAGREQATL